MLRNFRCATTWPLRGLLLRHLSLGCLSACGATGCHSAAWQMEITEQYKISTRISRISFVSSLKSIPQRLILATWYAARACVWQHDHSLCIFCVLFFSFGSVQRSAQWDFIARLPFRLCTVNQFKALGTSPSDQTMQCARSIARCSCRAVPASLIRASDSLQAVRARQRLGGNDCGRGLKQIIATGTSRQARGLPRERRPWSARADLCKVWGIGPKKGWAGSASRPGLCSTPHGTRCPPAAGELISRHRVASVASAARLRCSGPRTAAVRRCPLSTPPLKGRAGSHTLRGPPCPPSRLQASWTRACARRCGTLRTCRSASPAQRYAPQLHRHRFSDPRAPARFYPSPLRPPFSSGAQATRWCGPAARVHGGADRVEAEARWTGGGGQCVVRRAVLTPPHCAPPPPPPALQIGGSFRRGKADCGARVDICLTARRAPH